MVYLPATDAGKTINEVMEALNTAQHQWNTYATQLGRGYTTAYKKHQEAIDDVNKNLRLKAESAYWLLSLLCVAFAGGVAGGLMAPWVAKAGAAASKIIIRNKVSAATANSISGFVQKGTDLGKPETKPLVPAVKDPLSYWQDMLGELGLCFSYLRDAVEQEMKDADTKNSSVDAAKVLVENFMNDPLLKHSPSSKDMPDEGLVAREAEVGMWIAWAGARDLAYWKKANAALAAREFIGNDYYDDAIQFQPVVNRLMIVSYDAFRAGSMTIQLYGNPRALPPPPTRIINIPGLDRAGYAISSLSGANLFLRRVSDVVKSPQQVLPQLDKNPPIYRGN